MEMKKALLPAPPFHRAERSPDRRYSPYPPLSKDDYSEKDTTSEMEKKKAPLPAPPFYKEYPLPRAERSPDRRYSPYPPVSKDNYSGKYAGSRPRPLIYHQLPSWSFNEDGTVDVDKYITELFAARDKDSVWSAHTITRPQFGPTTSAEYVLDPLFKDAGLDMSVFGYLLPLIGHKVASAADAPNSSGQVGTPTGYRRNEDCSDVPVREVAALKNDDN